MVGTAFVAGAIIAGGSALLPVVAATTEVTAATGAATAAAGAAGGSGGGFLSTIGVTALYQAGQSAGTALVAAGPAGWIVLGTASKPEIASHEYTYDCWKPVVRDTSSEASCGVLLRDFVFDSRIKHVSVSSKEGASLPTIVLQNIWDEEFKIDYVMLSGGHLAAHASRVL